MAKTWLKRKMVITYSPLVEINLEFRIFRLKIAQNYLSRQQKATEIKHFMSKDPELSLHVTKCLSDRYQSSFALPLKNSPAAF